MLHGYHNVSVHEIQKRANVSIGSIYNHFGGKEGIARALYQHILKQIEEMVDDTIAEIPSPVSQCESIIEQLFQYTETHRDIIAFVFNAKHVEFLPQEPLICDAAPFIKMRNIVQDGMKQGLIKKADPWVATSVIFGGAFRLIQLRLDGAIDQPLSAFSEAVLEMVWLGTGCAQAVEPLSLVKSK